MKFFSLFSKGDLHLAAGKKVIPKHEYAELLSAFELLEKTKEEAVAYQEENKELRKGVLEEGRKEGFDAGLAEFYEHLLGFEQELLRLRQEMQKHVLPLALKAAKKIVGRQLEVDPETVVSIVQQVLAPVTESRKVILYVNRADKEVLEAHRPEIRAMLDQVELLSIQERADLSPGSSIIETESGIINATLENQWNALERAFNKYRKPET